MNSFANHEKHWNHWIPFENHRKKYENLWIPHDSYENYGIHIIPNENHKYNENLEISIANHCYEHLRISNDITKLVKILQFHMRIMKIMKTIEFTKSIMKIMKINEFHLKNNENH